MVKKFTVVVVALTVACCSLAAFARPTIAMCLASSLVGVRSSELNNVIVGSEFTEVEADQFVVKNIEARARIKNDHWALGSRPDVMLLSGKPAFGFLAYNQYGSTLALPNKSCVFIGPKGNNVDVIAHELVHADIINRLGYLKYQFLPAWLNEAIAMQVDRRDRYKVEAINIADPNYVTSFTGGSFYKGSTPQVVSNYAAAKHVVAQWISANGLESLPDLVDSMDIQ